MYTRRIPRNPNSPPSYTNQGLHSHWGRTVTILLITLLCLIIVRGQTDQPLSEAAPIQEVLVPRITPLPSPQPIVGRAVPQPSAADQVRAAVEYANTAFRDARARADASPLLSAATGEWLVFEQDYIAGLRARGQSERWSLLNLEIRNLTVQGASATVCTVEHWERTVINTDGSASSSVRQSFTERYAIVLQGANWLVSQISYDGAGCSP